MKEALRMSYANQFDVDGYCVIPSAIPLGLINEVNSAVNDFRLVNDALLSNHGLLVDGMLQRVVNLHYSVKPLHKIFLAAMNAGSNVVDQFGRATLYTSLFFELGSQQSLHRDTPYFYSGQEGGYMGVWAALDDVDEMNGSLVVVKGSHKLPDPDLLNLKLKFYPNGNVPPSSTPLFNAYNEELAKMARVAGLSIVSCKIKKGDLVIWNPATLHGGLPHLDKSQTRRSFVMHITPENMPMKHMDYFFNREKEIEPVSRSYYSMGSRLFVAGSVVDFRHIKEFNVEELGEFC